MDKLTPAEQKCGVKGRQMTEIIRNIDTVIEEAEEGYLILLDQQKAFDRVSHAYLFMVLEKMGFKGKFVTFIKALYSHPTCQVMVNGLLTDHIRLTRSVRQGCPISMLLFILASTPLMNMISSSDEIHGYITKRNGKLSIQAYADDTTVIIQKPQEYDTILRIYEKHANASEARINIDKTKILKLGKAKVDENENFKSKRKKKV